MKTIIKWLTDERSKCFLNKNFGLENDEFHTTVYYAEEIPLFKRKDTQKEITEILPVSINPSTYRYSMFGKKNDTLVLMYKD